MRTRRWSNVPGSITRELYLHDGVALDAHDEDRELPAELAAFVPADESTELVVAFQSSGYYDPGSMYGGWQNLGSPPEGEDERTLDEAYLLVNDQRVKLPQELQHALFSVYESEVNEQEIDTDD